MDDIYAAAAAQLELGHPIAFAVIVATTGSTPRKAGAKLLVSANGQQTGSIGGGCIEAAITGVCRELLSAADTNRLLTFNLTDEEAADAGLICGGQVRIWIERIAPAAAQPATGPATNS